MYNLHYGERKVRVEMEASFVGDDLRVVLTAGKAHIGAVALAVPCMMTQEGITASCSVLTVPGHRDNVPAESTALKLCKTLQRPVSVTAGLHLEHASREEIETLLKNTDEVVEKLLKYLKYEV